MPNEEWKRLQEALHKAPTPEARKEAAEAMRRYLATHPKKSRPTLVNLSTREKTYPNAVPVDQIADEIERNPEFFKLIKRVVTKERE